MLRRSDLSTKWNMLFLLALLVAVVITDAGAQTNVLPTTGKVVLGNNYSVPSKMYFDAVTLEVRGSANPTTTSGPRFVARFCNAGGEGSGVIMQAGYEHATVKPIEVLRLASFDGPAKFIFFNDGRSSGLSDGRLKTDIQPIEQALDRLQSVRGVSFRWVNGSSPQLGLIAQEVESAFPELVEETDGLKGVDYARFTAVLVQAINELKAEVDDLRRSNDELRARLAAGEAPPSGQK